jgi:hypothetical protein
VVEVEEVADARVVPESVAQNGFNRGIGCIFGFGDGVPPLKPVQVSVPTRGAPSSLAEASTQARNRNETELGRYR